MLPVSHLFPITTVTRRMFASFNVEWLFIEMSRITQGMDYYNRIVIRRDNVLPHYAAHVGKQRAFRFPGLLRAGLFRCHSQQFVSN